MRLLLPFYGLLTTLPLAINAFKCSTSSDTIMTHNASSIERLQARSASAIKTRFAMPWPVVTNTKTKTRTRAVRYCYGDEYTRNLLDCKVQAAFTMWAERLGYPAGPGTGHSLSWDEADDKNEDPKKRKHEYCFLPGLDENGEAVWNDKVAKDHLIIIESLGTSSWSTVGYKLGARYRVGTHKMLLKKDETVEHVAHELGHVFGMVHEFTRNDRDDYVLYTCSNIKGYSDAVAKAKAAEPTLSDEHIHDSLCKIKDFAVKYSFLGSQYVKNQDGRVGDDSPKFDVDSIMMYSSWGFANDEDACDKDKMKCPLLKYPPPEYQFGDVKIPEMIEDPESPSAGDIAWLKQYYPPEH